MDFFVDARNDYVMISPNSRVSGSAFPPFKIDPFLILFFCVLGSLVSPVQTAAVGLQWPISDSPKNWLVDPDTFHLSTDLSFTSTTSNFDDNGEEVVPSQLNSASDFVVRLHGGLPLAEELSLFGQIDVRNVNNDVAASANQPDNTRFGIGDAFVALRWSFMNVRRLGGRFSTAEKIDSGPMRLLLETGVVFPFYSTSGIGEPDLGDRALDIQNMLRYGWWIADDFAASAGVGYIIRNKGYSASVPYKLRMDYYFNDGDQFRIWGETFGHIATESSGGVSSTLAGGSSLIGSSRPTAHKLGIGGAFHPGKAWEVAVALHGTYAGENTAKASTFALSVAYRPLQEVTTAYYNPKQDLPVGGLARDREFDSYDIHAPVMKVSRRGNFLKIGYGTKDGVQMGDRFHIFEKGGLQKLAKPKPDEYIGMAEVVGLRNDGSFLRLRRVRHDKPLRPGMEARRIVYKDSKAIPRVDR